MAFNMVIIALIVGGSLYILLMFNNKNFILIVGNGEINANGRVIDIKDINYMGFIGMGKGARFTIKISDNEKIELIKVTRKCIYHLYKVCKVYGIKTDRFL